MLLTSASTRTRTVPRVLKDRHTDPGPAEHAATCQQLTVMFVLKPLAAEKTDISFWSGLVRSGLELLLNFSYVAGLK